MQNIQAAVLITETGFCSIFTVRYNIPIVYLGHHIWNSGVTSTLANKGSFIQQGDAYDRPRYLGNLAKRIINGKTGRGCGKMLE